MRRARSARRFERERGAGLLSTALGLTMCLVLMLFAAHILLALYTRTVVSAAAEEGARAVAQAPTDDVTPAEARVRSLLGRLPAEFAWHVDENQVALRITARSPEVLRGVPVLDALRTVRRTAHVRRERWR